MNWVHKRLSATLLTLLLVTAAQAQPHKETAARFLSLSESAEQAALGGGATAQGWNALFANPAGLAGNRRHGLQVGHTQLPEDIVVHNLRYARRIGDIAYGLGLLHASSGPIAGYDVNFEPLGDFEARDNSLELGVAGRLIGGLSLGFAGKVIDQQIENESARGFAVDVGLQFQAPVAGGLVIGAALRNLGQPLSFIEGEDPLPREMEFGAELRMRGLRLRAGATQGRDEQWLNALGCEITLLDGFALRGAYEKHPEREHRLDFGFGMRIGSLSLDYAYGLHEDLEETQRFSLGILVPWR